MKTTFNGFYTPSDEIIKDSWSNEKTLFIFDTNVLLNLYSYTEATRNDFFKIIDKITDKVWLPYHVGLEYQRNRLNVIKNEKYIFNNINDYLKSIEANINTKKLQELKLKQRLPDLHDKIETLHTQINDLIVEYKKEVREWDNKQPCVRSSDNIRKKIDETFNQKIGSAPKDQKYLNDLYEEGKKRYKNSVPPGYKDEQEKKDKDSFMYSGLEYVPMFGDLIIWKQIIEKASNSDIESLIFITDDVKEDWWYILDSRGKKEIGARAELRDEIYSNSDISSFEILRTTDFMKNGNEFLELEEKVKEESIIETKTSFENQRLEYDKTIQKALDLMKMNENIFTVDDDTLLKNKEFNNLDIDKLYDDSLIPKMDDLSYLDNYESEYKKLFNFDTLNYEKDYSSLALKNKRELERLKKQVGLPTEKDEMLDKIRKLLKKI